MLRPGPSAPAGVIHRFSIMVRTPVRTDSGSFQRDAIVWDGVSREGFSGSATVANHAIPLTGSVADHAQVQPRQFNAEVYAATPLEGDRPRGNPPDYEVSFIFSPTWANLSLRADGGSGSFADGVRAIDDKLYALLGVPLVLFTARHGRLDNYALTSFSSSRGVKGKLVWDLSFQEIREAHVAREWVPTIPRAEKQAEPETQDCGTELADDESLQEPTKVTVAAAMTGVYDKPGDVYSVYYAERPGDPVQGVEDFWATPPVTLE